MADEINGSSTVDTSVTGDVELLNLVSLLATLLGVEDAATNPANIFAESIKKIASACGDTGNIQKYIKSLQTLKEQLKGNNDKSGDVALALNSATMKPNANVMNNYNKFLELKYQQESSVQPIELNNFFNNKLKSKKTESEIKEDDKNFPKTKTKQIEYYKDEIRTKGEDSASHLVSYFNNELNNVSLTDSERKPIAEWISKFSSLVNNEIEKQIKNATTSNTKRDFTNKIKIENLKNLNKDVLSKDFYQKSFQEFDKFFLTIDFNRDKTLKNFQELKSNNKRTEELIDSNRYEQYWKNIEEQKNSQLDKRTDEEKYNQWLKTIAHYSNQRLTQESQNLNDFWNTFNEENPTPKETHERYVRTYLKNQNPDKLLEQTFQELITNRKRIEDEVDTPKYEQWLNRYARPSGNRQEYDFNQWRLHNIPERSYKDTGWNNFLYESGYRSKHDYENGNYTPDPKNKVETVFYKISQILDQGVDNLRNRFTHSKTNIGNGGKDELAEAISRYTKILNSGAKVLEESNKNLEKVRESRNKIFDSMAEKSKTQGFNNFNVQGSIAEARKILSSQVIGDIIKTLSSSVEPTQRVAGTDLRNRLIRSETLISQVENADLLQKFLNNSSDSGKLKDFYNSLNNNDKKSLINSSQKLSSVFELINEGINNLINAHVQSGKGLDAETQKTIQSLRSLTSSIRDFSNKVPSADKNLRNATIDYSRTERIQHKNQQELNAAIRTKAKRDKEYSFIGGFLNSVQETLSSEADSYLNKRGLGGSILKGFNNFFGNKAFSHIGGEAVSVDNGIKDENGNPILSTVFKGGFSGTALTIGAAATSLYKLGSAITSLSKEAVRAFGEIEAIKTNLSVVYGSEAEANGAFADIAAYSIKSPFGVKQISEFAVLLKQSGVYSAELLDTLKMIGDVAGGNAEKYSRIANNYAQIVAAGKATSLDLRQFANAGLPVYQEIRKELGISQKEVRELTRKGEISAEIIKKVFKNMTGEGGTFNNAVLRGAETYKAKIQNLNDTRQLAFAEIGNRIYNIAPDDTGKSVFKNILSYAEDFFTDIRKSQGIVNRQKDFEYLSKKLATEKTLLKLLDTTEDKSKIESVYGNQKLLEEQTRSSTGQNIKQLKTELYDNITAAKEINRLQDLYDKYKEKGDKESAKAIADYVQQKFGGDIGDNYRKDSFQNGTARSIASGGAALTGVGIGLSATGVGVVPGLALIGAGSVISLISAYNTVNSKKNAEFDVGSEKIIKDLKKQLDKKSDYEKQLYYQNETQGFVSAAYDYQEANQNRKDSSKTQKDTFKEIYKNTDGYKNEQLLNQIRKVEHIQNLIAEEEKYGFDTMEKSYLKFWEKVNSTKNAPQKIITPASFDQFSWIDAMKKDGKNAQYILEKLADKYENGEKLEFLPEVLLKDKEAERNTKISIANNSFLANRGKGLLKELAGGNKKTESEYAQILAIFDSISADVSAAKTEDDWKKVNELTEAYSTRVSLLGDDKAKDFFYKLLSSNELNLTKNIDLKALDKEIQKTFQPLWERIFQNVLNIGQEELLDMGKENRGQLALDKYQQSQRRNENKSIFSAMLKENISLEQMTGNDTLAHAIDYKSLSEQEFSKFRSKRKFKVNKDDPLTSSIKQNGVNFILKDLQEEIAPDSKYTPAYYLESGNTTERFDTFSKVFHELQAKKSRSELFPESLKLSNSIQNLNTTLKSNDWLLSTLIDEAKMMNNGILVTNDDGSVNQKETNENYKKFALSASDYSTSSVTKAYADTLRQGQQAFVELLSKGLFEKEEYKNLTNNEIANKLGYGSTNALEDKLNAFGLSLEDNKEGFKNFRNETLDSVSALQKFNKNLLETADVVAHWKGVEESNRIESQKNQLEEDLKNGKYDSFFNIVRDKDESVDQAKERMKSTLLSDLSSSEVQAKAKSLNQTPLEYITGLMGAYKNTNGLKNANPLVKKLNRFSYDQSKTVQAEFSKDRVSASNTYLQTRLNKSDINYNSDIADFYSTNFKNGFSKIEDIDSAISGLSKLYTAEYESIAKLKEKQKIDAKSLSVNERKQLSTGETKLSTYQSEIDKVKTYKTTDYLKDDLSKSDDMMYQLWNFIAALTSTTRPKGKKKDTENNFRPLWERFTTQTLGVPAEVLKALNSSTGSYAKANGKKTNKADAELYAGQFFRAKSIREENTSLAKAMLSAGMSPTEMASMISRQNKTVGKANFNKKTAVDQEGTNATFRQYAYGKDSNIEVTKTLITSLNSQIEKMDSFFAGAAFQMEDASMVFEEAFKNKENYEVLQQAWKQLGYSQNDFSQLKDDINAFGLNVVESNENVKKFTEQLPNYLNELKKNTEELKKSTERIAALKTVFNEIKTNTTKNREEQKNIIYQYSGSYKETGREEFDNASFSIQKSIVESLKKALDSQDSLKKEADKKTAGNGFSTEMVLDLIRTYGTTLELYIEKADLIEKEISEKYGNNSNNNFINLAPVKEEIELGRTAVGLLERIEINTRGKSNQSSIPRAETAPSPINLSSSNPQRENLKGLKSRGYFDEIYDKWADEYKKTGTVSKAGYNQYINSEYNAKDFAEALVKRSNLKGDINPEVVKAGLNFGSSKLDLRYLKGEYQNNINYLSLFDKDFNKQTKVETAPNVNKNPEKSKAYEGTSLVTEKELEVATSFARALTEQGKTTVQPSQRLFNNTSSDSIFSRSATLGLESNGDVVTDKFSTLRFNFKDPSSFFSGSTIINPFANGTERLDGTNIDRHAFKYSALNEDNNRQRAIRNRIAANYLSDNIKGFEDFSKKDDTFFSNTEEVESSLAQNIKEIMTNGSDKEKKSLQDYAQKLGINLYDKSDFNIISSQLLEDTKNGNLSNELLWNTQKEERALDSFKENDKTGFFKDNNIETSEQFVQQIETLQNSSNPEDQQVLASLGESYGVDFSKYKDDAEGFKDALFDARENMDLLNFAGDKLTGVIGSMKGTIKDGLLNGLNESLVNIGEMVYNAESFSDICDALKSQWKAIASQMMQSIGAEVTNTGLAIATAGAKSVASGNAGGWGMVAAGLALAASGGIMSFTAGILKGTGKKEDDKSKDEETKIENLKDALSDLIDQAKTDAEYYQKNLLHKNALSANESVSSRSVRSVNDAIITPNGNVVTTHPDDYLIATKTPGSLINAGKSDSSFAPQITFTVINASGQNVQLGETESETDDDGNINIKATIIAVTGEAIASGELDEAFSAMQYRQKGIGSVMG